MPINTASGFNAGIAVAMEDPAARSGTPARLHFLPELSVHTASVEGLETSCYVLAPRPKQPFRLFFTRDSSTRPLTELEAYFALVSVDGVGQFSKVYACGPGVAPNESSWYLDAAFGDHAPNGIVGTVDKKVTLAIHRCRLKEGTGLGIGHLLSANVEWTSEDSAKFTFQYLTDPHHVTALGLAPPAPGPVPAQPHAGSRADFFAASTKLEDTPDPTNTFLRGVNSLLVSRLEPQQKLDFLVSLLASPTLNPYLSPTSRTELEQSIAHLVAERSKQKQTSTPARAADVPPPCAESAPVAISPAQDESTSRLMFDSVSYVRRPTPISPQQTNAGPWLQVQPIRSPAKPVRSGSPKRVPLSRSNSAVQNQAQSQSQVEGGEVQTEKAKEQVCSARVAEGQEN